MANVHLEYNCQEHVIQQADQSANSALILHGLLGCSPTVPTTAITLEALEVSPQSGIEIDYGL
jgi:hypothetical protein